MFAAYPSTIFFRMLWLRAIAAPLPRGNNSDAHDDTFSRAQKAFPSRSPHAALAISLRTTVVVSCDARRRGVRMDARTWVATLRL